MRIAIKELDLTELNGQRIKIIPDGEKLKQNESSSRGSQGSQIRSRSNRDRGQKNRSKSRSRSPLQKNRSNQDETFSFAKAYPDPKATNKV